MKAEINIKATVKSNDELFELLGKLSINYPDAKVSCVCKEEDNSKKATLQDRLACQLILANPNLYISKNPRSALKDAQAILDSFTELAVMFEKALSPESEKDG